MANRVQIPVYTDSWMKGDRYGTVVATSVARVKGRRDPLGRIALHVLLDKSRKTIKVLSDDCQDLPTSAGIASDDPEEEGCEAPGFDDATRNDEFFRP